jgi:hypothetical protein
LQHLVQGVVWADIVDSDPLRQLYLNLLQAAGLLETAAYPVDVRGTNTVILLEKSTRPDISRQLPFRNTDTLAPEILRLEDAPVGPHNDRCMTECT